MSSNFNSLGGLRFNLLNVLNNFFFGLGFLVTSSYSHSPFPHLPINKTALLNYKIRNTVIKIKLPYYEFYLQSQLENEGTVSLIMSPRWLWHAVLPVLSHHWLKNIGFRKKISLYITINSFSSNASQTLMCIQIVWRSCSNENLDLFSCVWLGFLHFLQAPRWC